jgi:hypothetical protein
VFISKTRQHRDRVSNIKGILGMNNYFDGFGNGGGLALYWKDEIKIQLLSYRLHHIDTLVWDGVHYVACVQLLSMESHKCMKETKCES